MTLLVASNSNASEPGERPCESINFNTEAFAHAISRSSGTSFKLLKSVEFKSNNYSDTNKLINAKYTYPQGFYIDEQYDLLYIIRYSEKSPARAIIEKYQWNSGKLINTYILPAPQKSISEGLVVDKIGDSTTAYIRTDNQLTQYELIDIPGAPGTVKKIKSLIKNVAQSFYRKDKTWYTEDFASAPDETGHSRGHYSVYNEKLEFSRSINLSAQYTGYRESQKLSWPKHQGFAVLDHGYVFSMGGHWRDKDPVTPYSYFGINILNSNGDILQSTYLSPHTLLDQLSKINIHANIIENEGIQPMRDGTLVTLEVVRTQDDADGKLLFLQPNLQINN